MENQEQLDILKQGVKAWNAWREGYPDICPDLSYANLSGAFLSRANLSRANLSYATLNRAFLINASLDGADLSYALQLHLLPQH